MLTIPLWWICFGLLDIYMATKADEAAGDNPLGGIYWIKGKGIFGVPLSLIAGPYFLPFTMLEALDWYQLTRKSA